LKLSAQSVNKVLEVKWVPNQRTFVQLLDQPQPMLKKYTLINSSWVMQTQAWLKDLRDVTCFSIDEQAKYAIVGTQSGLVQAFHLHDFSPAT